MDKHLHTWFIDIDDRWWMNMDRTMNGTMDRGTDRQMDSQVDNGDGAKGGMMQGFKANTALLSYCFFILMTSLFILRKFLRTVYLIFIKLIDFLLYSLPEKVEAKPTCRYS